VGYPVNLKQEICSLFEVHLDEKGVQRVITPLEYPGSAERIVVRVRPIESGYQVDENGEAAFYASISGGDVQSRSVVRWAEDLSWHSPVTFDDNETLATLVSGDVPIAPHIFRVAEAAQQLYALATNRTDRQEGDFKERVAAVVDTVATRLNLRLHSNYELPIAGGLVADHFIEGDQPLVIIAATSPTRLLEAEVIHMQYRMDKLPGFVLAVAESQATVGKKQFERAAYYTDRTVIYSAPDLDRLVSAQMTVSLH